MLSGNLKKRDAVLDLNAEHDIKRLKTSKLLEDSSLEGVVEVTGVELERRTPTFGEIKAMSLPELKAELKKLNIDGEDEKEVLMSRLIDALGLAKTFLCPWEGCDGAFDDPSAMETHIKADHIQIGDDKGISLPATDHMPLPAVPTVQQAIVQIITEKPKENSKRTALESVLPDVEQQKERQKMNMLQRKRNAVARKIYKNLGSNSGVHSFSFDHKFRQSHLFDIVFDQVPTETKDDKGTKVKMYTTKQQIQEQFGKHWVDKIFSLRYGSEVVNTTLETPLVVELDSQARELRISGKYTAHQKQLRNSRPSSERPQPGTPLGKRPPGAAEWKSRVVRLW